MKKSAKLTANAISLSQVNASKEEERPVSAKARSVKAVSSEAKTNAPVVQKDEEIQKLVRETAEHEAKLEEVKADVIASLRCVLPYIDAARVAVQRYKLSSCIQTGARMQDAKNKAFRMFKQTSGAIQSRYANTEWLPVVQDIIGIFQISNIDIFGGASDDQ